MSQNSLIGKSKKIVDMSSFVQVPRASQDLGQYDPEYVDKILGIVNLGNLQIGDYKKDLARIAIGSYWDLGRKSTTSEAEIFDSQWPALKSFYDSPINIEHCFSETKYVAPAKRVAVEKISFYCDLPPNAELGKGAEGELGVFPWLATMKTGLIDARGVVVPPLINASVDFYDHYHEVVRPFTPKEQLEKVFDGNGKTFIANYKTYYNERLRSAAYENAIGQRYEINNALPSVYGFLRIISNNELAEEVDTSTQGSFPTRLDQITSKLKYYYSGPGATDFSKITIPTAEYERNILYKYPFETLVTLYGTIGTENYDIAKTTKEEKESKIIHKIVHAPYDSTTVFNPYKGRAGGMVDIDGLFESYFNEYTHRFTTDTSFKASFAYNTKLQALEKSMMNILFDPSVAKINNKVDKYKNYFPFYNEIEFSTQVDATLSDHIDAQNMTDIFIYHVASSWSKARESPSLPFKNVIVTSDDWGPPTPHTKVIINPVTGEKTIVTETPIEAALDNMQTKVRDPDAKKFDYSIPHRYVDLNTDPVTQTLETGAKVIVPAREPVEDIKYNTDILKLLDDYIQTEDYFGEFATNTYDIRNFVAHLKSDLQNGMTQGILAGMLAHPDNIFNKAGAAVVKEKILELYDEHKRGYKDILEGIPAHAEDLFYSISKYIIQNDGSEYHIQNAIFPNSSKLNLIKYVDTQVKYNTSARYRYKIRAHRLVFGSKYRYQWAAPYEVANSFGDMDPDDAGIDAEVWGQTAHIPNPVSIEAGYALPAAVQGPYPELLLSNVGEGGTLAEGVQIHWADLPPLPAGAPGAYSVQNSLGGVGLDYSNFQGTTVDGFYKKFVATLRVKIEPSIQLVTDKIFETPIMMIMDKPPVPPHVDIIPYRAVNNKILILLDGLVDRYRQEPIPIMESDFTHYDIIKAAQLSVDGKIEFGSDDVVGSFQIFRTDKHPQAYTDFEFYKTLTGGVFEETILPNKKYYYTFRSIDAHGHISNPSSIYEVELIDMKGAVKPLIRAVPLYVPDITDDKAEVHKYIYLAPSDKQLYFSDSPDTDSIFSSNEVRKKYKIRLTSKSTGKKIDINVSFQKKFKLTQAMMELIEETHEDVQAATSAPFIFAVAQALSPDE